MGREQADSRAELAVDMYSITQKFTGKFWKESAKTPEIYSQEMRKGLEKSVNHLLSRIVPKTPVDTSTYRNSILPAIRGKGIDMYGSVGTPLIYSWPIEAGRKKKTMPNIEAIQRWFEHKGFSPREGRTIRQSVFLIARKIKEKGYSRRDGWQMFTSTFKEEYNKVVGFLEEARDRIIKRLS